MPVVLGVSSGERGTAVEARDLDTGRLIARGAAPHVGGVGGTQHPEVWWDGMVDAIAAAGLRHEVTAIAVAAQRQAVVLLDGAGAPVIPASLRSDPRAAAVASGLVDKLGAERLARNTGQVTRADTPLARLAWLAGHDHRLPGRTVAVCGATEHLTYRLTGRLVADRGSASATGWWSPGAGRWQADLLDRVARPTPEGGWGPTLAALVEPGETADRVRATVHALVGLRGRPVVAAGTDDVMARSLAAALPPGATAALLDDDGVVVGVRDEAVVDTDGFVQSFADATGRYLPTVNVLAVGPVLEGAARLLGTDAHGLAALAAASECEPHSAPVVVGFRAGGPARRPSTRAGALLGLAGDHLPADVARAALHGAAADLLDAVDRLGGGDAAPLVLAGAHATWPGLAEAVADLAGRAVVSGPRANAATGACVLAAAALGDAEPLEVAAAWGLDAGTEVEPSGAVDGDEVRAAITAVRLAAAVVD